MGERATCPVCQSYSSNVLHDIQNGDSCRNCGCPNELIKEYQIILERKEVFEKISINTQIIQENEKLIIENMALKTKIKKLTDVLGYTWDSNLLNIITQTLNILHDEEHDNTRT